MDGEKIDWLEFFSWKKSMRSVMLNEQSEKFDIYVYRKDENLFYCRESLYKLFEI